MIRRIRYAFEHQGDRVNFTGKMPMHMVNVRLPRRKYRGNYLSRWCQAFRDAE